MSKTTSTEDTRLAPDRCHVCDREAAVCLDPRVWVGWRERALEAEALVKELQAANRAEARRGAR
jgi:phosphoribosyl-dephospho-CoA transferase